MASEDTRSVWLGVLLAEHGSDAEPVTPDEIGAAPVLDLAGFITAGNDARRTSASGGLGRCPTPRKRSSFPVGDAARSPTPILEAGATGCLVRCGSVDEILNAIALASENCTSISVEVTSELIAELVKHLGLSLRTFADDPEPKQPPRQTPDHRDKLRMVFQPIVELADRKIVGAEALARFSGPPSRSPSRRFAEAPTVGLRVELELRAVRMAIEALPELPEGVYLAFNVSPVTLMKESFQKLIEGAEATRLVAEVTEHAPIRDYDRLGGVVGELRSIGMRLAVDDAGAGFASLQHILKLSPDLIKLDLTLIRNIQNDRSKQALAAGLISFADKSGATIIAEGIERAAEARTLIALGVRHGQGYYLGRPGSLPFRKPPISARDRATRI
jgi:EAL domain-containing protein (putative c-di-GMP-specific phosphodiesterase class I)